MYFDKKKKLNTLQRRKQKTDKSITKLKTENILKKLLRILVVCIISILLVRNSASIIKLEHLSKIYQIFSHDIKVGIGASILLEQLINFRFATNTSS